jgi:spore coat protein A
MFTRRELIEAGLAAGAFTVVPADVRRMLRTPRRSPPLAPWADALPIPPVIRPVANAAFPGADYYEITMAAGQHRFHRDLPPARTWGYGGAAYLGPTLETRSGQPSVIKWINQLPPDHPLPVDYSLVWADPAGRGADADPSTPSGPIPVVPHLHGGPTLPQFDGHPEAWWTPGGARRGHHYVGDVYRYANNVQAATLWYHDHAMGITRLNVYQGLAGVYLVRDDVEAALGLPTGRYEVPIVLQDRFLSPQGALMYPAAGVSPHHPVWMPEAFADLPVVNGKVQPHLDVEPRRYRLRLLNGSNARFYALWLEGAKGTVPLVQVGTEGSFLPEPVVRERLLLATGERADVLVDFSGLPVGATLVLRNDARAPYPSGDAAPLPELMQFRIARARDGSDRSATPDALRLPRMASLPAGGATRRAFVMSEEHDTKVLLLNGERFMDPVRDRVRAGAIEIWEYVNLTPDAHPMHMHLVQYQVLDRQAIDAEGLAKEWKPGEALELKDYLRGAPQPPPPHERGWKDTAIANPGEVLRIIARFDRPLGEIELPRGLATPQYVHHCHILEHEDNEMMRPFELVV